MDPVGEAKANVLRHSGTSADEAAQRILGAKADGLARAAHDSGGSAAARFWGPDGPIFHAARLLTAERRMDRLVLALAASPLDGEGLWTLRRDLALLEGLATPPWAAGVRQMRSLLDGLLWLSADWGAAGVTADRARSALARGVAGGAAALFIERLRSPRSRPLDLLLDGLPFVLGYLRDRSVRAALTVAPGALVARHLTRLHDALWDLCRQGAAGEPASFERLAELDLAIESVLGRIRKEPDSAAQLAALGALYRLALCAHATAARDLIRRGIDETAAAAQRELATLGLA